MKRQIIFLCFSLILLILLISSCAQSMESVIAPSSETPSQPVSTTPVHSLTPLPIDSPKPLATDPLIPPTPTMLPTLPVEEARAKLLRLLSNNGSCHLPCLWGITPGISNNKETQAILIPLSSISDFSVFRPEGGGILPGYSEGDLKIYIRVSFLINPNNGIANRIVFNAEAHKPLKEGGYEEVFDSKFFGDKVTTYMLSPVLAEYGVPSSVMIATLGGLLTRGGTGGFDILLLYPDQGILVNYTTQMHIIGTNVRGCLSNAHVEMELYPSGQGDLFFELLQKTDWAIKMNYYKPLEEATSMTRERFYEAFREPGSKCIETPANFWPTPEP